VEAPETKLTLNELPIGSRLIVRSRTDWRFAAISKIVDERVVLTVCSPSGRTYRLRRDLDTAILWESTIPVIIFSEIEEWRENFCCYDLRW
jgi:hypothetical protein